MFLRFGWLDMDDALMFSTVENRQRPIYLDNCIFIYASISTSNDVSLLHMLDACI